MRYVYEVKSGTFVNGDAWFNEPRMFSSLVGAKAEVGSITDINRAEDINHNVLNVGRGELVNFTYYGEERKYKGIVVVIKHKLRNY